MRKSEKYFLIASKLYSKKFYFISKLICLYIRIIFGFDIQPNTKINKTVQFVHNGLGCVIHPKAVIEENCMIYQNVTIGGNVKIINGKKKNIGAPIIKEGCIIYSGACIAGPVVIGKNSIIGANAVVTKSIPDNSIVSSGNIKVKSRKD